MDYGRKRYLVGSLLIIIAVVVLLSVMELRAKPNDLVGYTQQSESALAVERFTAVSQDSLTMTDIPLYQPPKAPKCASALLGKWPESNPYFSQVHSPHIGYVSPNYLRDTLASLIPLMQGKEDANISRNKHVAEGVSPGLVLFALDGTLLNLLRWGMIHNDNDIDLGFYYEGQTHIMEQYYLMLRTLEAARVIFPQTDRDRKRLHSSNQAVRVGKCKHRGQIMQCRHKDTGVYIDLFGPDTLFSIHSKLRKDQLVPLRSCRSFDFEFPCPRKPLEVLTSVTLDFGQYITQKSFRNSIQTSSRQPSNEIKHPSVGYNEFQGCPLFPRNTSEQSPSHLESIIMTGQMLHECGYPNLLQGTLLPLEGSSKGLQDPDCLAIMAKAKVIFNPN